uniref:Uncharacterized protein n=1 Tax=Anguilla anguilla TaxID=7936 RepID=A0A0E9SUE1_ANGAN
MQTIVMPKRLFIKTDDNRLFLKIIWTL